MKSNLPWVNNIPWVCVLRDIFDKIRYLCKIYDPHLISILNCHGGVVVFKMWSNRNEKETDHRNEEKIDTSFTADILWGN